MGPTRHTICRQPSPCWRQIRYLAGPKVQSKGQKTLSQCRLWSDMWRSWGITGKFCAQYVDLTVNEQVGPLL